MEVQRILESFLDHDLEEIRHQYSGARFGGRLSTHARPERLAEMLPERPSFDNDARAHSRERSALLEELERRDQTARVAEAVARQAIAERDEALDLAAGKEEVESLLEDAILRIRLLQHQLAEAETVVDHLMAQHQDPPPQHAHEGPLSVKAARQAIGEELREARSLPHDQRRRRLRAMRLQWHPDKHTALKELASEITKLINEAIESEQSAAGEASAEC